MCSSEVISRWEPRTVGSEAASFAREVVACLCPDSESRARNLLYCTSQLAQFCVSVGLDLDPQVVLADAVIERFARAHAEAVSPATCRTMRTNLRFVSAKFIPQEAPVAVALVRQRAKPPYRREEIAAYLAAAALCGGIDRQMHAIGLICLSAGAGLVGRDLATVAGSDVCMRHSSVVVEVRGRKPRVVPVLSEFHVPLLKAAEHAGGLLLIGGSSSRKNVTSPITSASRPFHLGSLEVSRLRSYWLAECAKRIGLHNFMAAAGITCSQHLGDVVKFISPPDERDTVRLLGT
jgi:hypothetical protein